MEKYNDSTFIPNDSIFDKRLSPGAKVTFWIYLFALKNNIPITTEYLAIVQNKAVRTIRHHLQILRELKYLPVKNETIVYQSIQA